MRRCAMWKNLLFYHKFYNGVIFIKRGPKLDICHANFGLPSFILEILGKIKSGCLEHKEKGRSQFRGPRASRQPCILFTAIISNDSGFFDVLLMSFYGLISSRSLPRGPFLFGA